MTALTPAEATAVQDWLARRAWQVRWPLVGRRRGDSHAPFVGNVERFIRWQIEQEPWRRRG